MSRPFVTRLSTLVWALVCFATLVVIRMVVGDKDLPSPGTDQTVVAMAMGVCVVSWAMSWFNSIVMARRAQSTFWLVIAIFLPPPFNAFTLAIYCPAGAGPAKPDVPPADGSS